MTRLEYLKELLKKLDSGILRFGCFGDRVKKFFHESDILKIAKASDDNEYVYVYFKKRAESLRGELLSAIRYQEELLKKL